MGVYLFSSEWYAYPFSSTNIVLIPSHTKLSSTWWSEPLTFYLESRQCKASKPTVFRVWSTDTRGLRFGTKDGGLHVLFTCMLSLQFHLIHWTLQIIWHTWQVGEFSNFNLPCYHCLFQTTLPYPTFESFDSMGCEASLYGHLLYIFSNEARSPPFFSMANVSWSYHPSLYFTLMSMCWRHYWCGIVILILTLFLSTIFYHSCSLPQPPTIFVSPFVLPIPSSCANNDNCLLIIILPSLH